MPHKTAFLFPRMDGIAPVAFSLRLAKLLQSIHIILQKQAKSDEITVIFSTLLELIKTYGEERSVEDMADIFERSHILLDAVAMCREAVQHVYDILDEELQTEANKLFNSMGVIYLHPILTGAWLGIEVRSKEHRSQRLSDLLDDYLAASKPESYAVNNFLDILENIKKYAPQFDVEKLVKDSSQISLAEIMNPEVISAVFLESERLVFELSKYGEKDLLVYCLDGLNHLFVAIEHGRVKQDFKRSKNQILQLVEANQIKPIDIGAENNFFGEHDAPKGAKFDWDKPEYATTIINNNEPSKEIPKDIRVIYDNLRVALEYIKIFRSTNVTYMADKLESELLTILGQHTNGKAKAHAVRKAVADWSDWMIKMMPEEYDIQSDSLRKECENFGASLALSLESVK